jgi:Ca-activated chloride channel family protein
MTFIWPQLLWLLLVVPLVVAGYLFLVRRKAKSAARYANLSMLREAAGRAPAIRRHIPPALFLAALVAMIVATARPAAIVSLPAQHETVMLAIDVSGSMRATDVPPNRLAAAQAAARTFVEEQPRSTRLGVVAFAATALVVQHPTQNRQDILSAIERLQLQRGTALGSAIVVSLGAIYPDEGITLESVGAGPEGRRKPAPAAADSAAGKEKAEKKPLAPGSVTSAAIILISDGQRTTGPEVLEAARAAAERGVRVYTVGIGTPEGEVMGFEGWRMRVRLDEDTLKNVASITHAEYFSAGNAAELKQVYRALSSRFTLEKKETEVTSLFSALAAVLAVTSALLSLAWFNRIL